MTLPEIVQTLKNFHPGRKLHDEKQYQAVIEELFLHLDITHDREHRLNPKDIPDFWLPEHETIIEVKIAKGFTSILRQLARYALHDKVKNIILITAHPKSMNIPEINGKPFTCIEVWKWNL
jgi:hypothetical protein